MHVTKPNYISQNMFDRVLQDLFSLNTAGGELRFQMAVLLQLLRGSADHAQVLFDIDSVASQAKAYSPARKAEIAYVMGMQLGFELAIVYPPTAPDGC